MIVAKEIDSGKVHTFREPDKNPKEFLEFAKQVTVWIGHNFLGFDAPTINRLLGTHVVDYQSVIDTLIVTKLLDYSIEGGNSLDAWGRRLGTYKSDFTHYRDFLDHWDEGLAYCVQDVEVNYKLYKRIEPYITSAIWRDALRLEHDTAILCETMSSNGFAFNIQAARSLHLQIVDQVRLLTEELREAFPPKPVFVKEFTPKVTKHGTISRTSVPRWLTDLTAYDVDCPFSTIEWEEFNPASPKRRVEELNKAGWKPFEKTKGHIECERELANLNRYWSKKTKTKSRHTKEELETKLERYTTYGWTVSEDNLATLPKDAPEAAGKLVQWLLLNSRRSTLEEWFNAYSEDDKRIHGRFNHIGAWTGRMSHSQPNMANIPSFQGFPKGREPKVVEVLNSRINPLMRSFWTVPDDSLLVGVDADGIQLRILAHYMNDPTFIQSILNGKKEDGTDIHSMNRKALGEDICRSRDDAKTFKITDVYKPIELREHP